MVMADSTPLFLGIDIGTQSARVGVCSADGVMVSSASSPYGTSYPRPGWAEQDAADWWRAVCAASKECLARGGIDARRVEGISFDATSATVLMVEKDGTPLASAILWMDQRAVAEVEQVARTGHAVLRYVGGQDSAEWMVPKALWLKRNHPDLFRRAHHVLEATEWLAQKLCGSWVTSLCTATCKWNYVPSEGGWDRGFLEALGAPELLDKWPPTVVPMGARLGALTVEAARQMGLVTGTPVAMGGIDAYVGLLGLNALDTSRMGVVIGTSSVLFVLNDEPVFSPRFWGPYRDVVLPGKWAIEGGQTSTGSIVNWIVGNLPGAAGADRGAALVRLEAEAAGVAPGAEGLVMLDYWQGNRTPRRDPRARGVIFGLTLAHEPRHLLRAAYEGIVFGSRHILEELSAVGVAVSGAAAGGGGTKSRIWPQLMADVCDIPITVPRDGDACGVIGSAVCAAVGAGRYASLREASAAMVKDERVVKPAGTAAAYEESYRKYLELYEGTKALL
jgi:FGGY-family pentulose kinase